MITYVCLYISYILDCFVQMKCPSTLKTQDEKGLSIIDQTWTLMTLPSKFLAESLQDIGVKNQEDPRKIICTERDRERYT